MVSILYIKPLYVASCDSIKIKLYLNNCVIPNHVIIPHKISGEFDTDLYKSKYFGVQIVSYLYLHVQCVWVLYCCMYVLEIKYKV